MLCSIWGQRMRAISGRFRAHISAEIEEDLIGVQSWSVWG